MEKRLVTLRPPRSADTPGSKPAESLVSGPGQANGACGIPRRRLMRSERLCEVDQPSPLVHVRVASFTSHNSSPPLPVCVGVMPEQIRRNDDA